MTALKRFNYLDVDYSSFGMFVCEKTFLLAVTDKINAGVHANVGMTFQKGLAVYLFLEKYADLQNERYFIAVEHHDDVVFGYLNSNEELKAVDSYQAKKSSSKWSLKRLISVIKGIAEVGESILQDTHPKDSNFSQRNYFATNNSIELKCKSGKPSTPVSCLINETNEDVAFKDLEQPLKDEISKGSADVEFTSVDKKHLDSIQFRYVDLGRTSKAQQELLIGKFNTVFGDCIIDHKAALHTFLLALGEVEGVFNQNSIATLNDNKKRLESSDIADLIDVLTTKKLALQLWREEGSEICRQLGVSLLDKHSFKLHYENSFDLFKDLGEVEHRKVLSYVKDNKHIIGQHTTEAECIKELYDSFKRHKVSTLLDLQLRATISAAFIEVTS